MRAVGADAFEATVDEILEASRDVRVGSYSRRTKTGKMVRVNSYNQLRKRLEQLANPEHPVTALQLPDGSKVLHSAPYFHVTSPPGAGRETHSATTPRQIMDHVAGEADAFNPSHKGSKGYAVKGGHENLTELTAYLNGMAPGTSVTLPNGTTVRAKRGVKSYDTPTINYEVQAGRGAKKHFASTPRDAASQARRMEKGKEPTVAGQAAKRVRSMSDDQLKRMASRRMGNGYSTTDHARAMAGHKAQKELDRRQRTARAKEIEAEAARTHADTAELARRNSRRRDVSGGGEVSRPNGSHLPRLSGPVPVTKHPGVRGTPARRAMKNQRVEQELLDLGTRKSGGFTVAEATRALENRLGVGTVTRSEVKRALDRLSKPSDSPSAPTRYEKRSSGPYEHFRKEPGFDTGEPAFYYITDEGHARAATKLSRVDTAGPRQRAQDARTRRAQRAGDAPGLDTSPEGRKAWERAFRPAAPPRGMRVETSSSGAHTLFDGKDPVFQVRSNGGAIELAPPGRAHAEDWHIITATDWTEGEFGGIMTWEQLQGLFTPERRARRRRPRPSSRPRRRRFQGRGRLSESWIDPIRGHIYHPGSRHRPPKGPATSAIAGYKGGGARPLAAHQMQMHHLLSESATDLGVVIALLLDDDIAEDTGDLTEASGTGGTKTPSYHHFAKRVGHQLAARVRSGQISAEQAVKTHLQRTAWSHKFGSDWRSHVFGPDWHQGELSHLIAVGANKGNAKPRQNKLWRGFMKRRRQMKVPLYEQAAAELAETTVSVGSYSRPKPSGGTTSVASYTRVIGGGSGPLVASVNKRLPGAKGNTYDAKAVRAYQAKQGLLKDGIVGHQTVTSLRTGGKKTVAPGSLTKSDISWLRSHG